MELSRAVVEEKVTEYENEEPLYAVEDQHVEMLPRMFSKGEFGRRDVKWVVEWYYRRFLGEFPNRERRAIENSFDENDFETVRSVIDDVTEQGDVARQLERLTELEGVDVPLASAFLLFVDPDEYIVVGQREWNVLREAGELDDPYPDPPSIQEYETYLENCRDLADELDCDMWTLYQTLWRLAKKPQQ